VMQAMIDSPDVMTSSAIEASVLTEDLTFETLAAEWDELLDHSDQRAFFLRWAWNQLWWRTFRPPHSHLFIITCRDSRGALAGLAPLYWKQRRTAGVPHLRELQFLGTGIYAQTSEYLDVVARRGYEQAVAATVADFLRGDPNWDRLCLTEVPADSTVFPLLQHGLGEDAQITGCNRSFYINTDTDWDTFRSSLTKSARENIFRRTRRLFETFQCEFRLIDSAGELEQAMDDLVRLHQARWQTKGEPGTFALDGSEELLREAARISLREGRLRLWTLTMDKEVTAVLLGFVDNGVLHAFQSGFDPAYTHKGLGSVMNGLCIRACVGDEAVRDYDFMGGSDAYKQSWTKTSWDSVTLTCLRPGLHSQAFKTIELASRVGKSIVRKTVPRRLKVAGHKFIMRRRYYSGK
jgi:CelD/BcsL family acetyltransferase involved in cellulose biosynthesis